jgi:DNA polymerase III delta prime subunit
MIEDKTLPRFSIIVGKEGSQSDEVAKYIANKTDRRLITLEDVKVDTIRQMISDAYNMHKSVVFNIPNADNMSANAKNALLKITEEPPNRAYFIMCLEDLNNTLATIKSRGAVFVMDNYTPTEIVEYAKEKGITDDDELDIIRDLCSTPGEVDKLITYNIKDFNELINDMADSIMNMSGAEAFTFANRFAMKDSEDKYDLALGLKAFQRVCSIRIDNMSIDDDATFKLSSVILLTSESLKDLKIKGINKLMLYDSWMLNVRRVWK